MTKAFAIAAMLLATTPMQATLPADDADTRLKVLFAASDEASLKRDPLEALARGDLRYANQFGDYLSDAHAAAERAAATHDLAALHAISRDRLTPTDRIAYDVFEYRQQEELRNNAADVRAIEKLLPLDQSTSLQTQYAEMVSGDSVAPFKTVADYEANLKRMDGFVCYLDDAIALFRQGLAAHVTQPRPVVEAMLKQIDPLAAQTIETSVFMAPTQHFPDAISTADQSRLKAAYAEAVGRKLLPAYARLRDFLRTTYLPAARTTVGLSALPGGAKLYAKDIEQNTTLSLDADEIHQLGLNEVARDRSAMEAILREVGFKGDLRQFFDFFRTDPRFKVTDRAALDQRYKRIASIVEAHVPEQFSTLPKTPFEIRPIPDYQEKAAPPAYYEHGTPDGKRPGIFYYNSYDLPTRITPMMPDYFLHEGIPGHHFQISLAQENAKLPAFMRFGGDTAFLEGWALYSETLWKEMGVETDPYDRFGGLNGDIFRGVRLVLDTGIHAKGWTRDQAIQYALENCGMSRVDIESEVDRYIAWPGQALAYKLGQITILKLKDEARKSLGAKFDPRSFHAQVLMTGSLPLPVLERKVRAWIAAGGTTPAG